MNRLNTNICPEISSSSPPFFFTHIVRFPKNENALLLWEAKGFKPLNVNGQLGCNKRDNNLPCFFSLGEYIICGRMTSRDQDLKCLCHFLKVTETLLYEMLPTEGSEPIFLSFSVLLLLWQYDLGLSRILNT